MIVRSALEHYSAHGVNNRIDAGAAGVMPWGSRGSMVKRMDVPSRLLLGGVAGVAGAVWGWVLGFDGVVIVAIAIGAALPAWLLSRLVMNVSNEQDDQLRSLDEIAARRPRATTTGDGQLADVYVMRVRQQPSAVHTPRLRHRAG
jgi:hypothetical protein